MHGFALIMGSVFGHSWAVKVLKQCQKLVTSTKASHKLRHWLRTEMDLLKLSDPVLYKDLTWLVLAATTRFSSTYNCMLSVLRLQQASTTCCRSMKLSSLAQRPLLDRKQLCRSSRAGEILIS